LLLTRNNIYKTIQIQEKDFEIVVIAKYDISNFY
jgi:hypothetical protein